MSRHGHKEMERCKRIAAKTSVEAFKAKAHSLHRLCSAAPSWYNAEEVRNWLRRNKYSEQIADDLCGPYAAMLQKAFEKGYEIGKREVARQNDDYATDRNIG